MATITAQHGSATAGTANDGLVAAITGIAGYRGMAWALAAGLTAHVRHSQPTAARQAHSQPTTRLSQPTLGSLGTSHTYRTSVITLATHHSPPRRLTAHLTPATARLQLSQRNTARHQHPRPASSIAWQSHGSHDITRPV